MTSPLSNHVDSAHYAVIIRYSFCDIPVLISHDFNEAKEHAAAQAAELPARLQALYGVKPRLDEAMSVGVTTFRQGIPACCTPIKTFVGSEG